MVKSGVKPHTVERQSPVTEKARPIYSDRDAIKTDEKIVSDVADELRQFRSLSEKDQIARLEELLGSDKSEQRLKGFELLSSNQSLLLPLGGQTEDSLKEALAGLLRRDPYVPPDLPTLDELPAVRGLMNVVSDLERNQDKSQALRMLGQMGKATTETVDFLKDFIISPETQEYVRISAVSAFAALSITGDDALLTKFADAAYDVTESLVMSASNQEQVLLFVNQLSRHSLETEPGEMLEPEELLQKCRALRDELGEDGAHVRGSQRALISIMRRIGEHYRS